MNKKRLAIGVGIATFVLAVAGAGAAYASSQDGPDCGTAVSLTKATGPTAAEPAAQPTDGPDCLPAAPAVPALK